MKIGARTLLVAFKVIYTRFVTPFDDKTSTSSSDHVVALNLEKIRTITMTQSESPLSDYIAIGETEVFEFGAVGLASTSTYVPSVKRISNDHDHRWRWMQDLQRQIQILLFCNNITTLHSDEAKEQSPNVSSTSETSLKNAEHDMLYNADTSLINYDHDVNQTNENNFDNAKLLKISYIKLRLNSYENEMSELTVNMNEVKRQTELEIELEIADKRLEISTKQREIAEKQFQIDKTITEYNYSIRKIKLKMKKLSAETDHKINEIKYEEE